MVNGQLANILLNSFDLKVGRLRSGNKFGVKRFATGTRAVTKRCTPFRQWKTHADLVSEGCATRASSESFNFARSRCDGSPENISTQKRSQMVNRCSVDPTRFEVIHFNCSGPTFSEYAD